MKHLEIIYIQLLSLSGLLLVCIFASVSHAASVSDLLISEIMANPVAVSDTSGEWIELYNPTSEHIELSGIVLSDDGSNRHSISSETSLLVNPGDYFVLGRSDDSAINGGFTADYVYSGFTLGNSSDQIIFSDATGELLRLDYTSGFVPAGASMELIDAVMLPGNYAASTTAFGAGDLGTPGTAGSYDFSPAVTAVPLPGAVWLFGSGLLGLASLRRKIS